MFLGEIVKKYRLEHKISMDEFARLSGLSKGYISMLEKNENPRTKKTDIPINRYNKTSIRSNRNRF